VGKVQCVAVLAFTDDSTYTDDSTFTDDSTKVIKLLKHAVACTSADSGTCLKNLRINR
jgi:hypothetical protein